ncbi:hypothetical protein HDU91_002434 [Kappamyces sp. JEL0680]|nr:hypothetical protein HDU91_002434 [Kappamyces sp. JEL0680]
MKTRSKSHRLHFLPLFVGTVFLLWTLLHFSRPEASAKHSLDFVCALEPPKLTQLQLIKANRARLEAHLESGLVILPSSLVVLRDESGKYDVAGSLVLINKTASLTTYSVVLPSYSRREIVFSGSTIDRTELAQLHDLHQVVDMENLPELVRNQVLRSPSKNLAAICKELDINVEYSAAVEQAFLESRFVKTPEELIMLKYASQVASYSHKIVEDAIRDFSHISESKLAALFSYVSTTCGCNLQAYNPIVGSGKHAAVLHFPTGQTPDSGLLEIPKKDLILIDAAGAYQGYASDLTRTYARKDSKKRRLLSTIVLDAQLAGIKAHKVGNKASAWSKVVNDTLEKLTEGLWKNKFLISDDLDTLVASGVISIFMPHGVGQYVALRMLTLARWDWRSTIPSQPEWN